MYAGTPPPVRDRFAINILENGRSELLLLRRSHDAALGAGLWGFPAGHIEAGESPRDCARRELLEEIGADIRTRPLGHLGPVRDSLYGGIYELHLFHHRWLGGAIRLNQEHTEYAWVGREHYRGYSVMDGVDEDIHYFGIWPPEYLNREKLPGDTAAG